LQLEGEEMTTDRQGEDWMTGLLGEIEPLGRRKREIFNKSKNRWKNRRSRKRLTARQKEKGTTLALSPEIKRQGRRKGIRPMDGV